jgi:hypothetical protein
MSACDAEEALPEQRFAIASDSPVIDSGLRFDLDDMVGIADLIVERFLQ